MSDSEPAACGCPAAENLDSKSARDEGRSDDARDSRQRLRHIDTLRAIAALLVLWLHVAGGYLSVNLSDARNGHWIYAAAASVDVGRIGVVVFFLISGFVIPFSIHPERNAPISAFVIKRVFRIFPAYWLSIPFGVVTGFWLWGQAFGVHDFLINLTLLQDVFGARPAEGVYWTLLVELGFYALCVVLLVTRSLFNMRRVCALALVLAIAFSILLLLRWAGVPLMGSQAMFWFLNLSVMLFGTLYRSCVTGNAAADDPLLRCGLWLLLAWYLAILPAATIWAVGVAHNAAVSYALGFALFIAGTRGIRIATRLTDWIGRISYSIYLFHPIVFMLLLWWLLRKPPASWWRSQHLATYVLVNAVLTIGLASLTWRFVEKPCIGLGHRLARRVSTESGIRLISKSNPSRV